MENLSNSLSRGCYNGNGIGFAAKTVYDDVFGGPPKFGVPILSPRVEDYTEIFGSFHATRASSIPILDLPAIDKVDASFDARSSKFDYSEVFSGFSGLDLAVSYEELFNKSKAGDDSSEEAWTPAQSESLSDESDPSACSEKNQGLSNGDSCDLLDGIKQFNISYHKADQRRKDNMLNGMTHVSQLCAVPGFVYEINETLPKLENENTSLQGTSDLNLGMDFSGRIKEGKQFRKTMSNPANSSFGIQTFESDLKPLKGYGKMSSSQNGAFLTVSDINLQTQPSQLPPPSRPPPVLAVKELGSGRQNSKLKASKSYAFERMGSDNSLPFFDVEVDASSSAVASAAAMKDAMEKAQAKLKSAKELMERKKEGLQSHKLGLKNDIKVKKGEISMAFDGSYSSNKERVQGTCDLEGRGMKDFAGEERQNVTKTTRAVSNSIVGERHINADKKAVEKRHGNEYRSSEAFHKTGQTVACGELSFSEVAEADRSKKVIEQSKDEKILVHNTKSRECGQAKKASMEAFDHQENNSWKIKAVREAPEWKEKENRSEVAWEWDESKGRSKATKESLGKQEHDNKIKVAKKVCQQEENEKKLRIVQRHEEFEKIVTEADKNEENEKVVKVPRGSNGVNVIEKVKEVNVRIKTEKRSEDAHEIEDKERRAKETTERGKPEKILTEANEQRENEKRQQEALEKEEKEIQGKEACERAENEKKQKEACEREENEKRLKDALKSEKSEENEERFEEALEWEENEKKLKLACEREENEKRLIEALKQEESKKKLKEALEQEKNAKNQKEAYEREENEVHAREEASELEEKKRRQQEVYESEECEKRFEKAFQQEEIEERSEKAGEWEETENRLKDSGKWKILNGRNKDHEQIEKDGNDKKPKVDQETCVYMERENLKASDGACKQGDSKNLQSTQVACKNKNCGKLEMTKEVHSCEEDGVIRTELRGSERELEAVEQENAQVEEIIDSSIMVQDGTQLEKNQIGTEDDNESLCVHDNVKKLGEDGTGICIARTHIESKKKASEMTSDSENHLLSHEKGEREAHLKKVQVTFDQEESKDRLMSSQVVRERIESVRKMGIAQPDVLEGARNAQKTAPKVSTSQSTERKEKNLNEVLTPEEKEKEKMGKRERELEQDHLRKIEEEREREREREKDQMAVERATHEACERAFAEARERAERAAVERATAEVRQRAMAGARERLEKASAEARERMLADKASMEARFRAERTAVERATAEARERAVEKAMAEKAAFGARERAERSIADKLFTASRDGVRHCSSSSDLRFQGLGSSSGSRYSHSSVYGGVEGESAQRCKARLERHQRTAERAAKALAEKNMRDLLAQREQAERTRLAEALDAEVKRWSSGKEGNLRALLSTLQYILGPDGGWQPIPLTEVITSVAVKKAYRKATLCVHPDKLQQRGASIQQKYICEKVFDLLKEAWNKFNSEER